MQITRGAIQNRERYMQGRDFSGMRFPRNITPSDLDGVIEFSDKLFIFFEFKAEGAPMPTGQRLMLERLADTVCAAGKVGVAMICDHNQPSDIDIACHEAIVREYRYCLQWVQPRRRTTLYEAVSILYMRDIEPI